jgi:hypothetical protein
LRLFHHKYSLLFTSYGRLSSKSYNIRLLALISSIYMDTVSLWWFVYSNSASICLRFCVSLYWRTPRCVYCIGGWFRHAGRYVCVCVCSDIVSNDIWAHADAHKITVRQSTDKQNLKQTDAEFEHTSLHKQNVSIQIELIRARRRMLYNLELGLP